MLGGSAAPSIDCGALGFRWDPYSRWGRRPHACTCACLRVPAGAAPVEVGAEAWKRTLDTLTRAVVVLKVVSPP